MPEKLIECPRDPKSKYFKWACESFRDGSLGFRPWCKSCPKFKGGDNAK